MTQIEQVKAEIERRMAEYKKVGGFFTGRGIGPKSSAVDYYYTEDEAILAFIESLEKERDTSFESAWGAYVNSRGGGAITTNVKTLSKQFYELGCIHAAVLYDDIEHERQRRQEAEKPKGLDEAASNKKMAANLSSELHNLKVRGLIKENTYEKYKDWLKTIH